LDSCAFEERGRAESGEWNAALELGAAPPSSKEEIKTSVEVFNPDATSFLLLDLNTLLHCVHVRAVPVHAMAGWACGKTLLGEIDKRRDSLEYSFLVHILEGSVAFETARKDPKLFEIEFTKDLLYLLPVVVACNEDTLMRTAASRKAGIAREDDAILGLRETKDFIVLEGIGIHDVASQHPKPSRKLSDHNVGDELRFHGIALHAARNFDTHQVERFG
jgi:hypothetical protein